jgi:hypothetical protein
LILGRGFTGYSSRPSGPSTRDGAAAAGGTAPCALACTARARDGDSGFFIYVDSRCDGAPLHGRICARPYGMASTAAQVARCAVPSFAPRSRRWEGEAACSPSCRGLLLASRPGMGLIPTEEGRRMQENVRNENEADQLRGCQGVGAVPCDVDEGKGRRKGQASRRSRFYRAARLCGYVDGLADEQSRRRGDRRCGFGFGDKLCAYVDPLTPAYATVDRETNGEAEGCRRCAMFASNKVRRANAGHPRRMEEWMRRG